MRAERDGAENRNCGGHHLFRALEPQVPALLGRESRCRRCGAGRDPEERVQAKHGHAAVRGLRAQPGAVARLVLQLSEGGITGTIADPRIILKKALEENAVSLVLCHNHPSGSLKPSRQDEEITKKIKEAARYFDIKVLDHIIVSDSGYFSFADEGIL